MIKNQSKNIISLFRVIRDLRALSRSESAMRCLNSTPYQAKNNVLKGSAISCALVN